MSDDKIYPKFDMNEMDQKVMDLFCIQEELDLVSSALVEGEIGSEEAANILMGISRLYKLKISRLHNIFIAGCNQKKITY